MSTVEQRINDWNLNSIEKRIMNTFYECNHPISEQYLYYHILVTEPSVNSKEFKKELPLFLKALVKKGEIEYEADIDLYDNVV